MLSPDPCAVPCGGTVFGIQISVTLSTLAHSIGSWLPKYLMLSRAIGFLDMKANIQNRKFPVVTQQREKWCGDL